MFGFIRRALARRKLGKRELFRYHDGQQFRYGDPYRIFRAIVNNDTIDLSHSKTSIDLGEEPETTKAVEMLCTAFGVQRFDGHAGLSDWEVLELLDSFTTWMDALKKNGSPSSILSPNTEWESSTSPECPSEATSSSVSSGSMPSEFDTAATTPN